MTAALVQASPYLTVIAGCLALVGPLSTSRWTWRSPAAAIVLWQTLALSLAGSAAGAVLAAGLSPYGAGELFALVRFASASLTGAARPAGTAPAHTVAVLLGLAVMAALPALVGWHFASLARLRRRHRALLSLVADVDPHDPGLLRVEHPGLAAYCLPGRRPAVVVSAGTVGALSRDQLAAVLEHERAHARERHDLVLLPFAALRRVLPRSRLAAGAYRAVALLVEMRADDRALRRHPATCVASALRRLGGTGEGGVPAGALGAGDAGTGARLERITHPPRRRSHGVVAALALASAVASTPASHFFTPW